MVLVLKSKSPPKTAPKPTIAQVRKLVPIISSNKDKLKVYCDLNTLDKQLQEAEQRNDSQALEALNAQADSLERKISPEYTQVMDGLELVETGGNREWPAFTTLLADELIPGDARLIEN